MTGAELKKFLYSCKQSMTKDGLLRGGLAKRLIERCELLQREKEDLQRKVECLEKDVESRDLKLSELKTNIIEKIQST